MRREPNLEQELKQVMSDLASRPAPDHLVERIAEIPRREPPRQRSSFPLGLGILSVAAAAVLVVVAVVIAWPGRGPTTAGPAGPGSSTSPSVAPSTAPSQTPTSGPSIAPTSPPSTPPGSIAAGPAGGPIPARFAPGSVTFVSSDEGFVLGNAPCASPPCTSVLRTTDGGTTWVGIPAPRAAYAGPEGVQGASGQATGVSGIRFADPLDGWAYGPSLWATHDRGATWHEVKLPGTSSSAAVVALETSGGLVHAAVLDIDANATVRVASSPIDRDSWTMSTASVPIGAGPVPTTQIVLQGSSGWLLQVDRTVVGGLRLVNGSWQSWTPVCADVTGPAVLAASTPTNLVAACDVGLWATPEGEHLYASSDGGASFTAGTTKLPISSVAAVATSTGGQVVLAGQRTGTGAPILLATFDGGTSWTVVHTGAAGVSTIGFTTATQGVAIASDSSGSSSLLVTRDGGHTWTEVAFAAK